MRIAISTGGGDAPGLNAVIRAAVLTAVNRGWEVIGVKRGFAGLLGEDEVIPLTRESVRGIGHLGGTILRASNRDRKSTRLNSSHTVISYAVFCLKKKKTRSEHAFRPKSPLDALTENRRHRRSGRRRDHAAPRTAWHGRTRPCSSCMTTCRQTVA